MRIGNLEGEITDDIIDLGFSITTSIKLLGYHISNNDDILDINFTPIKRKIQSIIRFWKRFYLSLQNTSTTAIKLHRLNEISGIMERFVTQGLSI